ncbi:MAG: 50S ribosomal protein L17 [Calditrichaceae bacterium]
MQHKKKGTHLGRTTSHKKALMRNMAAQVLMHKQIKTTDAKAKEVRRFVERLITYGKKGSLHHRRLAFKFLQNKEAVKVLFEEVAPVFQDRNGGYTRIIRLGYRKGDAASISLLQLVGFEQAGEAVKKKETKKAEQKAEPVEEQKESKKVTAKKTTKKTEKKAVKEESSEKKPKKAKESKTEEKE